MQQRYFVTLTPFKNYFCEALPCALGKYCELSPDDEKLLNETEIKTLCEYAIMKNVIAGVKEVYLKLPHYVEIDDLFDKHKVKGKIILPALEICLLPMKALVGDKLIFEIESFSDLTDAFLGDFADFVGDKDLPVMLNLGDNLAEVGKVVNRFKKSPTELAEEYGLLDRKCFVRGLNHVDKDDLALLKNYEVIGVLTPRDDANEGKGFINNYNLVYNDFPFGFGSGKCYNIDMLGEGRLSCQNTANLLSERGTISLYNILKALACEDGQIQFDFDPDARQETLLEERICLGSIDEDIEHKVKQIAKRLKEKE